MASRKKAGIILLYITGLRVSNLLLLKVQNIKDLLDKGKILIDLVKGGHKNHQLQLTSESCQILKRYNNSFNKLMDNKKHDQHLFTTTVNDNKPINRCSFNTELNKVLIKGSNLLKKNIRTHSFRSSLITDCLKDTPIDIVKEFIGHKDINATLQYKKKSSKKARHPTST